MTGRNRAARCTALIGAAALASSALLAQQISYPRTKMVDQVDTYHGTKVPDPYRWLEDDNAPDTQAWVEAQNKVTFPYLEKIPFRKQLTARVIELNNYEKYSAPSRKGPYFFFRRNEGLQNQSVLFIQKEVDGKPDVLIDPNAWSADGTTQARRVRAVTGRQIRRLRSLAQRFGLAAIQGDGACHQEDAARHDRLGQSVRRRVARRRFLLQPLSRSSTGSGEGVDKRKPPGVFPQGRHRQTEDVLVYQDTANPQRFHTVETTEDERFAILTISERGKGKDGNALYIRDLSRGEAKFRPVVSVIDDDSYGVVDNVDDKLLLQTNRKAPNWRVVLVDPAHPEETNWKDILPEKPEPLDAVSTAGGKLFATYLKDVMTRAYVYGLDGTLENEVTMPGPGSAGGFGGPHDTPFVFYTFNSLNVPPSIYRYDIATRRSTVFRRPKVPGYNDDAFETTQVFYPSKDGTRVPMFLVHRKGLKLDGNNPTLLYAYGGFNVVESPTFSAARLALLEQGFVYASANIRGGGEYGEKWHEQGMKLKKQNVFDDFIAAAEWLIEKKYTSSARLAIQGGSNGGLLVGAVMNQRPELFRVGIPQVGVMDMLRFHKFTIGWNWIADYGSSDKADEFKALYAYSPLHNIKPGVTYPATLITTADHDDRVVPAHSFKYAATLQALAKPDRPVLIRIDTKSGHGASNLTKQLETTADIYSFVMYNVGAKHTSQQSAADGR